ncbi:AmmeMemoRadiSam system protein A [Thermosulfurimonas marina]|uniref:AmmeMemoRadiSam system protein A n=1 Tax=Thermosulfurimonas marina TaxID=2047767 RepID=A0A6H1WQE3_9BACT|nr:AmmeMemoRadiSam system protein A [Thermosulfurimonas marina]QJA05411.1 AmmeMemoRadiSam system protein A [Thermosulfurimonas marina]
MSLSPPERAYLLRLARESLEKAFGLREDYSLPYPPPFERLHEPRGAFVTLKRHGHLRGCIGTFEAASPLYRVVEEMALAAAFNDPRFSPLSPEELDEVEIEISVLSPLRPGRPEEVEVGRHGVYLIRGAFRGVLLPQVAVEYGWDRETFLDHVCLKAGLPPRCWQDPRTEIYLFTAEVFEENEDLPKE